MFRKERTIQVFGYGKKKAEKEPEKKPEKKLEKKLEKKPELLEPGNIRLNCKPGKKEDIIREVGQMLCDCGAVDDSYIEAMLKREETFATNIGNGIALPHGVEAAKKDIRRSAVAVMVFPEGTDWGGEMVTLVIGIAGAGDDHLEILSIIAEQLADPEAVKQIAMCSEKEILSMFTGKAGV